MRGYLGLTPHLSLYKGERVPPLYRAIADCRRPPKQMAICDKPLEPTDVPLVLPPELVRLNWAWIYFTALRVKASDAYLSCSLSIDEENLSSVLRIRAAKSVTDLEHIDFFVKTFVSQLGRSPYTHILHALQGLKKDKRLVDKTLSYGQLFHELLADALLEFELLLAEGSIEDDGVWKRLFDNALPSGSWGVSSLSDLIRSVVLTNAVELLRRYDSRGIGHHIAPRLRDLHIFKLH
jgi:hypothetical protein